MSSSEVTPSNWTVVDKMGRSTPPPVPEEAQLAADLDSLWKDDDLSVDETLDLRFDEFMDGDENGTDRVRSFLS